MRWIPGWNWIGAALSNRRKRSGNYRCSSCGSLRRVAAVRMATVECIWPSQTTPSASRRTPLLVLLPSDRRGKFVAGIFYYLFFLNDVSNRPCFLYTSLRRNRVGCGGFRQWADKSIHGARFWCGTVCFARSQKSEVWPLILQIVELNFWQKFKIF